ncbi:TPA: hypothetical protein ACKP5X_002426 [Stenotrophomonas maltophilia]
MSAQTKGGVVEGQLSFSFEISRDMEVDLRVSEAQERSVVNVVLTESAQVTCISSRRISVEKRDQSDAYVRVMEYARSLRRI